jgi:branched-chain amino acid transport system ATP-binding protein
MILDVEGLSKYFGGLAATAGVDLHVGEGEIVGLIGPNGAGKTTVFNLVSGALVPDGGSVRFKGRNIEGKKPHEIARMGIARTFQSVKVFSRMSTFDNVLLGHLFGAGAAMTASARRDTGDVLAFVGLEDFTETRAQDLILANQKRLEVARALAAGPSLLLLDEVMAGLTPTEVASSMELVKKIRDRGVTVFMIEHVMKAIMNICDRIIVLHHGEKIAEGTPQEIVQNRTVIEVYLGE